MVDADDADATTVQNITQRHISYLSQPHTHRFRSKNMANMNVSWQQTNRSFEPKIYAPYTGFIPRQLKPLSTMLWILLPGAALNILSPAVFLCMHTHTHVKPHENIFLDGNKETKSFHFRYGRCKKFFLQNRHRPKAKANNCAKFLHHRPKATYFYSSLCAILSCPSYTHNLQPYGRLATE